MVRGTRHRDPRSPGLAALRAPARNSELRAKTAAAPPPARPASGSGLSGGQKGEHTSPLLEAPGLDGHSRRQGTHIPRQAGPEAQEPSGHGRHVLACGSMCVPAYGHSMSDFDPRLPGWRGSGSPWAQGSFLSSPTPTRKAAGPGEERDPRSHVRCLRGEWGARVTGWPAPGL